MAESRSVSPNAIPLTYSDLVVIYLGMYVKSPRGAKTLLGFIRPIKKSVAAQPDGLLLHEFLLFSLMPLHAGMRQYWRDFDSLERWTRSGVHTQWLDRFIRNPRGTGFWHEAYSMKGGIDAIYDHLDSPVGAHPPGKPSAFFGHRQGLYSFAAVKPARGSVFSARHRIAAKGEEQLEPVFAEAQLYGGNGKRDHEAVGSGSVEGEAAAQAAWRERMGQIREGG